MGGFEVDLEVELTFVLVNVKCSFFLGGGGGGGRGTERTYYFKQTLCSDVELKDIFRCMRNVSTHTLDFRSSVSSFRLGYQICGWAI